jgi:ABC-2 type transport system permease protein
MVAELYKLRKRMMTWTVAVILCALVVLLYMILWTTSVRVATFGEDNRFTGFDLRAALYSHWAPAYALQVVGGFGAILAMILAAGSVGSEYAWGTVRLVATAASGRARIIASKLIVVYALVAVGVLLAIVTAVVCGYIIALYYGQASFGVQGLAFVRNEAADYGRTMFVLAPYIALAFSVAVIGRSTLAGVGTGLGVAFIEPLIDGLMRSAGSPWQSVPKYLLNTNRQIVLFQNNLPEVLPRLGGGRGEIGPAHSPFVAGLILAGYAVFFIALAIAFFRRRDIGSAA